MRILAVCGAGMGTSVMMKIKLSQYLQEHNINDVMVDSCGLDEGKSSLNDYNVIICSTHLVEELGKIPEHSLLIAVDNIMDISNYGDQIIQAIE